ncbi:hypothetical protein Q6325_29760, partial [Klebsiella pneumoniae]|nr:hypothetical protein [Klebsiella pneumoniae]
KIIGAVLVAVLVLYRLTAPPKGRREKLTTTEPRAVRWILTGIALIFIGLFLVLPLAAVFTEALRKGWDAYVAGLQEPDA